MKIFGLTISRTKTVPSMVPDNAGAWWPLIRESFTGAWQKNITIDNTAILSFHADFACRTLIASDIAKLRVKLVQQDADGVWTETKNPAYGPVLRKPNRFQNRIQFFENWVLSKLHRGNAYALKERDGRGVVVRLYVLDPNRCRPMVADDGSVFYELHTDNLTGVTGPGPVMVPAREIIHDRFNCLFHPLVGVSPLYANGLAATQGLNIQNSSAQLFANNSTPGGILTAPNTINKVTAERLKADWEQNFSGRNVGKVAVLGDGLKYEKMALTAVEGQLIEQLKWTAEVVCSTYHVPPYKIGIGAMPTYNNIQSLNVEYYSQCLQRLIEDIELCLDEGLEMAADIGTEFDIDGLLRMDSVTQMEVLDKAKGKMTPNEQRRKLELKPVEGGDTVYMQEQDHSLAALSKRDARDDPFSKVAAPVVPAAPPPEDDATQADKGLFARAVLRKELGLAA